MSGWDIWTWQPLKFVQGVADVHFSAVLPTLSCMRAGVPYLSVHSWVSTWEWGPLVQISFFNNPWGTLWTYNIVKSSDQKLIDNSHIHIMGWPIYSFLKQECKYVTTKLQILYRHPSKFWSLSYKEICETNRTNWYEDSHPSPSFKGNIFVPGLSSFSFFFLTYDNLVILVGTLTGPHSMIIHNGLIISLHQG